MLETSWSYDKVLSFFLLRVITLNNWVVLSKNYFSGFSHFSGRVPHVLQFFPRHIWIDFIYCWKGWIFLLRGKVTLHRHYCISSFGFEGMSRSIGQKLRRVKAIYNLQFFSTVTRLLIHAAKLHLLKSPKCIFKFFFFKNFFPLCVRG